jgi:hypothetical protein
VVTVYETDPLLDPRWEKLQKNHPKASIFHTRAWLDALRLTYGYQPIAYTTSPPGSDLQNAMVFCRIESWLTGRRLVSLPFSDHCEPLVESAEELGFLIDHLQTDLGGQHWKYGEVRPVGNEFGQKAQAAGFRRANSYYLHRMDLRPKLNEIFRSLHKDSAQRRIRHAERMGLVCERGTSEKLLKDFYRLLTLTRSRHHLPPQPYTWFKNLVSCMGSALEIRLAYKQGVSVAGILTLRFRGTIYYKYGCSDAAFKNLGAVPLLFWETIQDGKSAGAEEFDLGRSEHDNPGLITFKGRWAPGPTQLLYWRYPALDSVAQREGSQLRAAKRVFAYMPDSLLSAAGKLIYRHVG